MDSLTYCFGLSRIWHNGIPALANGVSRLEELQPESLVGYADPHGGPAELRKGSG